MFPLDTYYKTLTFFLRGEDYLDMNGNHLVDPVAGYSHIWYSYVYFDPSYGLATMYEVLKEETKYGTDIYIC